MKIKKYKIVEQDIEYDVTEESPDSINKIVTYKKNNIITRNNKPAVLKYKNNKLVGWIYFLNGKIHHDSKPAFVKKNRCKIWCDHGYIHREKASAVQFFTFFNNKKQLSLEIFYSFGQLHNKNNSAINIFDLASSNKTKAESFYVQYNKSVSGYNSFFYFNNKLIKKEIRNIDFNNINLNMNDYVNSHFKKDTSKTSPDRFLIEELRLKVYNQNYYELPSLVSFDAEQKINCLIWYKESLKHRENKPAEIRFKDNKVSFLYYENGTPKENIYTPHSITKDRYSKKFKILNFKFINSLVQNHYTTNKLTPFFLSVRDKKLIELNFSY